MRFGALKNNRRQVGQASESMSHLGDFHSQRLICNAWTSKFCSCLSSSTILWIFSGLLITKEVTATDFYNKAKIKLYIPLVHEIRFSIFLS